MFAYPSVMNSSGENTATSHYILKIIPSDDIDEMNEKFMTEEYEDEDEDYSTNFSEQISEDLLEDVRLPDKCNLCGNVGKLFKIAEAEGLASKINKYLPFIELQVNYSDCICYKCLSTINSWHSFYLNCSSINCKSSKKAVTQSQCSAVENNINEQLNKIIESLNSNSCTENILLSMDVLTDGLKSLINALKKPSDTSTPPIDHSTPNEKSPSKKEENIAILEDAGVVEITVNTTHLDTKMNTVRNSPERFKTSVWEKEDAGVVEISVNTTHSDTRTNTARNSPERFKTSVWEKEDAGVVEITVNTSHSDTGMNTARNSPERFKTSVWEKEDDEFDYNSSGGRKLIFKEVQTLKTIRNGTWFCDDDGYCFRVNKKHSGKTYVRCIEMSCRARGCIWKNLLRYNRQKHSHPPTHGKDSGALPCFHEEQPPLKDKESIIT